MFHLRGKILIIEIKIIKNETRRRRSGGGGASENNRNDVMIRVREGGVARVREKLGDIRRGITTIKT